MLKVNVSHCIIIPTKTNLQKKMASFNLYDDLEQMESIKLDDKPTGKEEEV